ncbi:biliverdin-producing heme oxygenase [Nocardia sp. NPDC049149]|uniref:biliverdin-producing heme oxygenase n=1 Tax=Nocardia sp. NPDC049149 TaxID=3364315 RepID=UPI00371C43CA
MIMQRLRAETSTWHTMLEATPFSVELLSRTMPLSRYVGQLIAYRIILDALEAVLTGSADPTVTAVWQPDLAKVPLLEQDLEFFDTLPVGNVPTPAIRAAQRFATAITRHAATDPVSSLGFLYVMEGSTMGALQLTAHIRATFGLTQDRGVAYYSCGDRQRWTAFAHRMNDAIVDEPRQQQVLAAADNAYRAITETLAALARPDPR